MKLKNIFIILLVALLPLFLQCSEKSNNPLTPSGDESIISKLDTTINVDYADAIINYQDSVRIRIPQGIVSGDTKLTIAKLSDNSIPDDEEMEFPNVYEITLGEQHVFDDDLEITLKYDPKNLNEGKFKYKIGAAYYNENIQKWSLFQNFAIDTLLNTVTVYTNHLTKLSWYHLKYAYGYTDYLTSPHFIIYWTDGNVPSNQDYISPLSNHEGTAPHYVQDILTYMEEARKVYKDENLTVPSDTTNKVEIRLLELDKGVDGNTSYFGFIRINQNIEKDNNFTREELVKITCAHELLHYVQDYYYMWTFEGNYIKWWLEATAVQADRIVWPSNSKFEAISYADGALDGQLDRAWDDCNLDPNYYIAGGFLTYLTTFREGAKLNIPEIITETGKASNISYFRTILDDHLKSKLSSYGIGHEYRDYVKWAHEQKGPIKINYIPPLSSTNANYVVPVRLTTSSPSWEGSTAVNNLAVKMVKIISPESTGSSSFKIISKSQDALVEQYLYISDRDKTVYKKYLVPGDTLKINLESKNQWIDILACNVSKDEVGNFDLSVELINGPTITSISPAAAKVGDIVKIQGNSFGESSSHGEVWFGSVKALLSDIVSWIDTQIEVKVPEGAITGDVYVIAEGEKSNFVNITIGGTPIITDIFDYSYYNYHQRERRFTIPNKSAIISGKNFGDYPDIKKVYVNNTEVSNWNWSDTSVVFDLPETHTGNVVVKLISSNGESNEFPYFCGLPLSYLSSCETIISGADFMVEYYNEKAGADYSKAVGTRPQELDNIHFNWNGRVLTANLNDIENLEGTIIYTFAENGIEIEKVEVSYARSDQYPSEIIQYTGVNFPLDEVLESYSHETTQYNFQSCGEALEQNTTGISGSLNYVDDLRANIDGIKYSDGCSWNAVYLKLKFIN